MASEHFYFWLTALKCFCEAESLLSVPCDSQLMLAKQISEACAKYHKGITTLKVCVNVNEPKIKLNNFRWSFFVTLNLISSTSVVGVNLFSVFIL